MNAQQARRIPIPHLLAAFGFRPAHENDRDAWYHSPLRATDRTPSFQVSKVKNLWNDHGSSEGGNALDLACRLMQSDHIPTVLQRLRDLRLTPAVQIDPSQPALPLKTPTLELVKAHDLRHPALIQYLEQRCIPLDIAKPHLKEVHYRNGDRTFFALGFPTDAGGYELRNALYQGSLAPKSPTWIRQLGRDRLVVFEGFMDMLSWLVLSGGAPGADALVLNSLVYAPKVQELVRNYRYIELYLDNDESGRQAVAHFPDHATDRGAEILPHKDLNEFLCAKSHSGPSGATFSTPDR